MSFGLLEQFDLGLLQRDVTGKWLEPREHVVPVLGDVLEEQRVALDMYMGLGNLPDRLAGFAPLDIEGTAGLQIAEHPEDELDVVNEEALEADDAVLRVVDHHVPFHGGENAGFPIGRLKIGVRAEVQCSVACVPDGDGPHEGIGQ